MKKKSKAGSGSEYALVYSTDPIPEKRCPGCHRSARECKCGPGYAMPKKCAIRIERKGRGGKTVTVLYKLPAHETLLKDLCARIKKSLGVGGTHFIEAGEGVIEIQGEHQLEVQKIFESYASSTPL